MAGKQAEQFEENTLIRLRNNGNMLFNPMRSALCALRRFRSYPPAEARIPLSAFLGAILPQRRSFNNALCSYLGVENCMLANSGRSLLYLLLSAMKKSHPERNEALVPGYTCYSVAASVAKAGLLIRPYDMDPKKLCPDCDDVKQRASDRTLAIVVQHLFGIPTPISELKAIAKGTGAFLIEDAAQALGGSLDGVLLGTQGDFGIYSFGRGKPLPLGSGGAMIGRDGALFQTMQLKRPAFGVPQYAACAAAQWFSKPYLYGILDLLPLGLGETVFDPEFEISAMPCLMEAVGARSLAFIDEFNDHRARIAAIYRESLCETCTVPLPRGAKPVYTRFPVLAKPDSLSGELRHFGIRRMYPKALVDEDAAKFFLAEKRALTPGAVQVAQNLITLPTHQGISVKLARKIAEKISRSYL